MELRHLRYFVAVAEHQHITAASQALRVAQPTVSQALRQLERELGLVLFERTNRGVRLTEAGHRLLEDARAALSHADRLRELASQTARGQAGVLHVGYLPLLNDALVTRAAHLLRQRRPDIDVALHELGFANRIDALRRREVDVVLSSLPLAEPDMAHGAVVHRGPRVLAVPSSHRLATRASVELEDLAGETLATITGDETPPWLSFWVPERTPSGRRIHRGRAVGTVGEMLAAVASGQAVVILPNEIAAVYHRPDIRFLPVDAEDYRLVPVWRADGWTALIGVFVATLREIGRVASADGEGRQRQDGAR